MSDPSELCESTQKPLSARGRIAIREMEIDDLADVFHLGEQLFTSDSYPILYRTWDPYEVTGLFNTDSDYCLVATTEEDELIGFILGTTIEKGTAWTYGYIIWLGVHPAWQRRQVGHRLIEELEMLMLEDGVRMFLADTSTHNKGGIRFFQKHGFERSQDHVYLSKTLLGDAQERQRKSRQRRRAATKKGEP